jgi:hypothetical protein
MTHNVGNLNYIHSGKHKFLRRAASLSAALATLCKILGNSRKSQTPAGRDGTNCPGSVTSMSAFSAILP